ncbi:hypothetical protein SAMN05660976_04505 [Nonomuraea pusilla]|uniref:Uncharacterized protein n=1 Tax=Nonomuraea pusilla TaxID=46177 RepID=A0A1H7WHC2_9ACTN|nr:hypothetical protein SAMN05660976_04505 [Nonomuraea pusilla]
MGASCGRVLARRPGGRAHYDALGGLVRLSALGGCVLLAASGGLRLTRRGRGVRAPASKREAHCHDSGKPAAVTSCSRIDQRLVSLAGLRGGVAWSAAARWGAGGCWERRTVSWGDVSRTDRRLGSRAGLPVAGWRRSRAGGRGCRGSACCRFSRRGVSHPGGRCSVKVHLVFGGGCRLVPRRKWGNRGGLGGGSRMIPTGGDHVRGVRRQHRVWLPRAWGRRAEMRWGTRGRRVPSGGPAMRPGVRRRCRPAVHP